MTSARGLRSRWRHVFEITRSYDAVYKWFDYLYKKGAAVCGYVVMPQGYAKAISEASGEH